MTAANLQAFDWNDLVNQTDVHCPLLVQILKTVITRFRKEVDPMDIGIAIATLMQLRNPIGMRFLKECTSIQMWKAGCSESVCSYT